MRCAVFAAVLTACGAPAAPASSFAPTPLATVESTRGALRLAVYTAPEQPPSRGTITAKLVVRDRSGDPVDGLVFDLAPEMPSMGHGTPVIPRTSGQGSGVYLAEDVDLYMAGRWDLRIKITGAVTDDAVITIDVR